MVKPHGLHGEVVVELVTDREERLATGSRLVATPASAAAQRAGSQGELVVTRTRKQRDFTERRRARYIVSFDEMTSVDAAEQWRGATLLAPPLDDPDTLWVDDLVGANVLLAETREPVGTCVALVANPASDLLELDTGALVPVVFVVEQGDGVIVIDPPAGLFDL